MYTLFPDDFGMFHKARSSRKSSCTCGSQEENQSSKELANYINNLTVSFAEFYDDDNGFGIVRKGKQHLSSDFLFDSVLKLYVLILGALGT